MPVLRIPSQAAIFLQKGYFFMDYYNNQTPPGSGPYQNSVPRKRPGGFATASLVLGIIAFTSAFTMTILPPLLFGSLSIILGILSRGNARRPGNRALAGIIVSAGALVINLAVCVFSFYIVLSDPDTANQYRNMVNETYEQMLGMSLDEILDSYGLKQ